MKYRIYTLDKNTGIETFAHETSSESFALYYSSRKEVIEGGNVLCYFKEIEE